MGVSGRVPGYQLELQRKTLYLSTRVAVLPLPRGALEVARFEGPGLRTVIREALEAKGDL